ncbi:MerR family transcriptional regulator [Phenylobacterium sp. LjRoot225]|uniref:MerR family transcriptional regulator n=1 Tax=Phenylobacterium sp. LjRoot225 TaxID=3342285 RepID=UPI003ECE7424
MQISELARNAQLTTRQVRHYEREGLIKPSRGANSYRDYPPSAVALARRIGLLVDLGFTTGEVRAFIDRIEEPAKDDPDLANRRQRLERLDAVIADLREKRAELVALLVAEPP